ncbi:putative bifunctional UDP-N-acetylglucosamine transferase and deubiquitinase ALG13 [Schistocerca americana]|uniref:putative bifunctional UDP-N-acetylglucosamine transferase and deubiquitinase ALG13 n=1 Tax=Schistocerca americana TaxID=7009 RepID=UPI001F501790|nr:putative bifunctional UDP-N-acetylglucosamine transferase and deubiquitinase ALG13 [Schistocerca americana]
MRVHGVCGLPGWKANQRWREVSFDLWANATQVWACFLWRLGAAPAVALRRDATAAEGAHRTPGPAAGPGQQQQPPPATKEGAGAAAKTPGAGSASTPPAAATAAAASSAKDAAAKIAADVKALNGSVTAAKLEESKWAPLLLPHQQAPPKPSPAQAQHHHQPPQPQPQPQPQHHQHQAPPQHQHQHHQHQAFPSYLLAADPLKPHHPHQQHQQPHHLF